MYTIVDLEQGTEEWREWRDSGIGSSDAPVIMGANPWKNIKQLLAEKLGESKRFAGNAKTERGTRLEPEARRRYELLKGIQVNPVVLKSRRYEWQVASLDGMDDRGSVAVEIKCGEVAYDYTFKNRKVPTYYIDQLQHILAVTGLQQIDFFCYLPGRDEVLLKVMRNDSYITNLISAELAFWTRLQKARGVRQPILKSGISDDSDEAVMTTGRPLIRRPRKAPVGMHDDYKEKSKARIVICDEEFKTIKQAAVFYGVREQTIKNWIHWLKFLPNERRRELVREIEVQRLDFANGVVGTEDDEERKANELKNKFNFLSDYFDSQKNAAEAYGVEEKTIHEWSDQLKHLSAGDRKRLIKKIKDRRLKFTRGLIGTERYEKDHKVCAFISCTKRAEGESFAGRFFCSECKRHVERIFSWANYNQWEEYLRNNLKN